MENQVYYIQSLLANEFNRCKGKENAYADNHTIEIQKAYQNKYQELKQPEIVDKGKQKEGRVQDEEVFLYKSYDISSKSSRHKTPKFTFIQDKVNNLDKFMKMVQEPVKTMPFYSPLYYKSL